MSSIQSLYERRVLGQPRIVLAVLVVVIAVFGYFSQEFKLDASADSLLLEQDLDLRYYRGITARYGSESYLIVTYNSRDDLFAADTLADIKKLRDELLAVEGLASVISLLDVPLINSPRIGLTELQQAVPNLESSRTDQALAREELINSPLYRELIMSADGRTTALLALFQVNADYEDLLFRRDRIRERQLSGAVTEEDRKALAQLNREITVERDLMTRRQQGDVAEVRKILDLHRDRADIRLGGLPMIVTDMLDYIRHDVVVFGLSILLFLIGLLATIFVRPRWVFMPMICCFTSVAVMLGYLGFMQWPVTVVSANFVALILIFSLYISSLGIKGLIIDLVNN